MHPRRLLLLTYHFPPSAASGAFRMLGFVQQLPNFGWDVSVVAPARVPYEPIDGELLKQVTNGTRVKYVPYPTGWASKPFRRAIGHAVWLPGALVEALRA